MSVISAQAQAAQDAARQATGQFGEQHHSAPQMELVEPDPKIEALRQLNGILSDHPDLYAHAEAFITPKIGESWLPDLMYVEYDDELRPEQLDAYLRGDDEPLDELEYDMQGSESYRDRVEEYAEELLGTPMGDLDDQTREQVQHWVEGMDCSTPIKDLIRHNGRALIQLPAVADDDAFGAALQAASEVEGEQERYTALEKVFHDTLTAAGVELSDVNKSQVQSLIDENSLDFGHQHSEQWRLRLVTYTDPRDVAMSFYSDRGDSARSVTVEHPYLLLVDPWNGRSHDVKLAGNFTTTIDTDRPARLDAALGYGSLDEIAGVVKSAYRAPVTITD